MKLIDRDAALNFELQAEADPDEIQAITKGMALYAEHIKSLPVIEVPTPHGRLIDADDMESITIDCDARGNWKRINAPTIIESEGEK